MPAPRHPPRTSCRLGSHIRGGKTDAIHRAVAFGHHACRVPDGFATPASAQTATLDLLQKLKEKGILSDEEYDALAAREAAAPAAATATTVTTGTPASPQQAAAQALDDKRTVRMTESGIASKWAACSSNSRARSTLLRPRQWRQSGRAARRRRAGDGRRQQLVDPQRPCCQVSSRWDVTTNQGGWDVGAHFGMYPGINSVTGVGGANSAGSPTALSTAGIDFRQTYLTFGKAQFGEIKIGRDIGLFASEAILNDITLLASGTPAGNVCAVEHDAGADRHRLYLHRLPAADHLHHPKFGGLQFSGGRVPAADDDRRDRV